MGKSASNVSMKRILMRVAYEKQILLGFKVQVENVWTKSILKLKAFFVRLLRIYY